MTYIPILVFVCIGGLMLLAAIAIIAALIWFLKRHTSVWQKAGEALQDDAKTYLAEQSRLLLAWNETALPDFSSNLEINGQQVFNRLHYRGRLKSLLQPGEAGWLAFDLNLVTGKGMLLAQTAERQFALAVQGGLFQDLAVEARVDGMLLGWLRIHGQQASLYGSDQRPLGRYARPAPQLRLAAPNTIHYLRPGFFDPAYTPVEIRERQAAEFNTNLVLSQHLEYMPTPLAPLYRNLAPDLTSEDQDWLVTLAVLESYLRIARHLSEIRR